MIKSQCSTSIRSSTKKDAKITKWGRQGMSSHRYSQHAPLHKWKQGKNANFFYFGTIGQWAQNKATDKNECQKGRKKREIRESHWNFAADEEKVALFWFACNSRGRLSARTEAHHVHCWKRIQGTKISVWTVLWVFDVKESHLIDHWFKGLFQLSPPLSFQSSSFCLSYKWTCFKAPLTWTDSCFAKVSQDVAIYTNTTEVLLFERVKPQIWLHLPICNYIASSLVYIVVYHLDF